MALPSLDALATTLATLAGLLVIACGSPAAFQAAWWAWWRWQR
jgi:hypothetical protein